MLRLVVLNNRTEQNFCKELHNTPKRKLIPKEQKVKTVIINGTS